ncbi:hypothetical protein CLV63_11953 [Murinocardiopsis flavida]|uniref:Uncharacterized protein n=1 Tax=Murinocardiopsis flavida TaxID=645275 RepID=A0A2P8D3H5_9ACTN|nr:hypothetical protein CLV63_11953 [Murinocardiopsis flavida]
MHDDVRTLGSFQHTGELSFHDLTAADGSPNRGLIEHHEKRRGSISFHDSLPFKPSRDEFVNFSLGVGGAPIAENRARIAFRLKKSVNEKRLGCLDLASSLL